MSLNVTDELALPGDHPLAVTQPAKMLTKEDLPSGIKAGNMCCSSTIVNRASRGTEVSVDRADPDSVRTVWCHLDVLAARDIPSTDPDGLCDPCYQVNVGDKLINVPDPKQGPVIMKSLNPNFMHRLIVPIEIEFDERGKNPKHPLPPVVFELGDQDAGMLSTAFVPLATISVKDMKLIQSQSKDGPIDVRPRRFLPNFTDFYRFFRLYWETSTIKNYHSQDSGDSGSRRIEFSSKSTTFLMW